MTIGPTTRLSPEQPPRTNPAEEEALTWDIGFPGASNPQRLQALLLVVTNDQVTNRHILDRARDHFYN
jgi:hypothetical protein